MVCGRSWRGAVAACFLLPPVSSFLLVRRDTAPQPTPSFRSSSFAAASVDDDTSNKGPPLSRTELERRAAVSLTELLDAPDPLEQNSIQQEKVDTIISSKEEQHITTSSTTQKHSIAASPPPKKNAKKPVSKSKPTTKQPPRRKKPWSANYHTSLATQEKIKAVAHQTNDSHRILSYLLSIPPELCNAANLVCAMTLASKSISSSSSTTRNKNNSTTTLQAVSKILLHLLNDRKEEFTFSTRQLANLAWSLAKFHDHDMIDDSLVDAIAVALAESIRTNPTTTKTQELCMSCWAYGILRKRERPTGWQDTPTAGTELLVYQEEDEDVVIDFQGFDGEEEREEQNDEDEELPNVIDVLLDEIAVTLSDGRIPTLQWKELANVAWSYATIGRPTIGNPQELLDGIAQEATNRLSNKESHGIVQSRDIAQLVWSLGVLQADNYQLSDSFASFVGAVSEQVSEGRVVQDIMHWSCADIVQTALSLAHARMDEQTLLLRLYKEATARIPSSKMNLGSAMQVERKLFHEWELSVLLWVQARLFLTEQLSVEYKLFTLTAMNVISGFIEEGKSLADMGIGPQERANIAWSLAVLECGKDPSSRTVLKAVFDEASLECKDQHSLQSDHAHQLWQALALLEPSCPECFAEIPSWFRTYLDNQWKLEKARPKQSSARHKALSKTLELMGVAHFNEHEADIDVAIVLKPKATWTHETVRGEMPEGVKVAVEFDGPAHFTREGPNPGPPRTLGHTVLKYRLLKQAGWTVVRVPYYEFDRIPFWASMERQRYVQRLLKTHGNLRFSGSDVSEYKTHYPNRKSRFD